ncbi:hypothetical protein D3C72_780020 [compost metagenome]
MPGVAAKAETGSRASPSFISHDAGSLVLRSRSASPHPIRKSSPERAACSATERHFSELADLAEASK